MLEFCFGNLEFLWSFSAPYHKTTPSYSLWLFPTAMDSLGGETGGKTDDGR